MAAKRSSYKGASGFPGGGARSVFTLDEVIALDPVKGPQIQNWDSMEFTKLPVAHSNLVAMLRYLRAHRDSASMPKWVDGVYAEASQLVPLVKGSLVYELRTLLMLCWGLSGQRDVRDGVALLVYVVQHLAQDLQSAATIADVAGFHQNYVAFHQGLLSKQVGQTTDLNGPALAVISQLLRQGGQANLPAASPVQERSFLERGLFELGKISGAFRAGSDSHYDSIKESDKVKAGAGGATVESEQSSERKPRKISTDEVTPESDPDLSSV